MLTLKLFYPANDKVRQVEFHPVLPWVVSATKSDHVAVWDWRTKQLVWEAHLGSGGGGGGSEDDLCADAELARAHLRDPAFSPNPSLLHPIPSGPKREPAGHVRDVRFLDCDVAQVQLTWQHTTASGCGTPPPRAEDIRALRGQRLLVVACESKLVVVDLASRRVLELGKGVFEGKAPSCLAFMFRAGPGGHGHGGDGHGGGLLESPVLAVGCSDGIVRCVQLFPVKPVARLVSAHKTPVVALAVVGTRGQRHDVLAVGHASGRVVLFEPLGGVRIGLHAGAAASGSAAAAALSDGVTPRYEYKAHERELLPGSLVVVSVDEDPENTRYRLFSAGSDNRLCGLDPSSLQGPSPELARIKVEGASVTCLAHWPRGWTASGVHSLLLGTEGGQLLLAHPASGSVRRAVDLGGLVPAGTKKAPKVYGVHVHPLMPYVVAAATNAGTAILVTTAPHQPLAAAPLPLAAPSQALSDEGAAALGVAFGGGGGAGATYVAAMGNQVLCVTASTLPNKELSDFPPNQVVGKLEVASGTPGGRPLVTVSCDGGYVAVAWPGARRYAVYQQGASAWREVARGTGTAVAWHSCRPTFAALEEDAAAPPPPPPLGNGAGGSAGGKSFKDSRKAERAAEAARIAAEAAARAAAAAAVVRVKELAGSGAAAGVVPPSLRGGGGALGLDLRGDTPSYVQGGPLLAVTVRRTTTSEAAERGRGGPPAALLLFDWDSGRRVGPELPEPLHLAWDPSRSMVALAYPSQLLIVRSRPSFQVAASLPVCGAESLEWSSRQLYIATPSHVLTALLAPDPPNLAQQPGYTPTAAASSATSPVPPPPAPPARLITLAGPGTPASPASSGGSVSLEGFLPPPAIRPPGPLTLLGPRDGCLWAVGVLGQPLALGLAHPGLRACCAVAAGDLHGAVSIASRCLPPSLHDQLAALMVELDGTRGAAAALAGLPGLALSLATQLRLRAALRQWQQAVEAAEALLAGYTSTPPPGQFRSAAAEAAFGGSGGGGLYGSSMYGGGGPALGDDFVDLSAAAGGAPANAPAHPEDLDWTQPLRAANSSARAAATAAVAARQPGGGSGAAPSSAAVQLVLGLMEDLQRAGMYDVIRHLAKPLLVHAVQLSGEQLRTLAGLMAQAGMKTELPSLLHCVAAGADSASREAAGLLAALLSGHTGLVQDSLREDGAAALAALQAQVYGMSAAADAMAGWRRQLAAATPAGAAAALGRLEVAAPLSSG